MTANPETYTPTPVASGLTSPAGAPAVPSARHLAVSLGIDLDEALRRVHLSNMSKRNPDGSVDRDASGKILKPAGYQPPSMDGVVRDVR